MQRPSTLPRKLQNDNVSSGNKGGRNVITVPIGPQVNIFIHTFMCSGGSGILICEGLDFDLGERGRRLDPCAIYLLSYNEKKCNIKALT